MKYRYKGSNKNTHSEIVAIGCNAGLQHSWREPMGEAIVRLANEGKAQFIQICEKNPKFFEKQ